MSSEEFVHLSSNPKLKLNKIRAFFFPFTAFQIHSEKGMQILKQKYPQSKHLYKVSGKARKLIFKNEDISEYWITPIKIPDKEN